MMESYHPTVRCSTEPVLDPDDCETVLDIMETSTVTKVFGPRNAVDIDVRLPYELTLGVFSRCRILIRLF